MDRSFAFMDLETGGLDIMQQSPFTETIFALSSGRLPAGVAVIRLSGPDVKEVIGNLCGKVTQPRMMSLVRFRDGTGNVIDQGLVVLFEGPHSFTGEDCAEFHLHGGRAVAWRMLEVLGNTSGLRMAEAGEFTRRAFLNGKMDLTEAEALADLISADTEAQRRFALENSRGGQKALYSSWREKILNMRALIEAELDFSDEEDVPGSLSEGIFPEVRVLAAEIADHAQGYSRAEIIRDGYKVAIVGAPNAGKSSLLNALARREVAIVSDEPGTTRDVVTVTLDLDGISVIVSDTAGIREKAGAVEALGIERSFRTAQDADLVVVLQEFDGKEIGVPGISGKPLISVISKGDLCGDAYAGSELKISSVTGEGLDKLIEEILGRARNSIGALGDVLPSRRRHLDELGKAVEHLNKACTVSGEGIELSAEELRLASDSLGRIIGKVDVEDLLDVIFSTFCIGK